MTSNYDRELAVFLPGNVKAKGIVREIGAPVSRNIIIIYLLAIQCQDIRQIERIGILFFTICFFLFRMWKRCPEINTTLSFYKRKCMMVIKRNLNGNP